MPLPVRWMAWESIFLVSRDPDSNRAALPLPKLLAIFKPQPRGRRRCSSLTITCVASGLQGKYTTKSDVWAFAVTLWEILNLGRRVPYEHLSDEEVVQSLRQLHHAADCGNANPEDGCKEDPRSGFDYLPRPTASSKDIYDLMLECWQREETERPTFREISLFLQRKNLGYAPTSWYWAPNFGERDVLNSHTASRNELVPETERRVCSDGHRFHPKNYMDGRMTVEWGGERKETTDRGREGGRRLCIATSKCWVQLNNGILLSVNETRLRNLGFTTGFDRPSTSSRFIHFPFGQRVLAGRK